MKMAFQIFMLFRSLSMQELWIQYKTSKTNMLELNRKFIKWKENIKSTDRCKCNSNKVFVGDDWSSFGAFTSATLFVFVCMRRERIFLCWLNNDSFILNGGTSKVTPDGIISFQGSFCTKVFYVIWKINLWKRSRSLTTALSKESQELLYRCASCHVTFFLFQ